MKSNQPLLLAIESSTKMCSVGVADGENILAIREDLGFNHSSHLAVFIEECVKEASIELSELDAIAVNIGPGSYTGLRIGLSTAKGLAYILDKPLIGVQSDESVWYLAKNQLPDDDSVLAPAIDARRMEVYTSFRNRQGEVLKDTHALILDEEKVDELSFYPSLYWAGDAVPKIKQEYGDRQHFNFIDVSMSCKGVGLAALDKFKRLEFLDVAYSKPFYLKSPNITTPKKKA